MAFGLCHAVAAIDIQLTLPASLAALVVCVAVTIGLGSAAFPAWVASKSSVVESLRYAG
jgi:ABC-type antimicrobial peptide transport system permease subunit